MGDGHVWLLAAPLVSLVDLGSYGIKEWIQLIAAAIGIVVSTIGAWKAWRFSKWQMVNRLFEYLNTDEKHITEGRRRVLGYLRNGRGAVLKSSVELHDSIEKAIKLVAADRRVEAEEALNGFALMLTGSAEVGRRHTAVASQQAATILLFVGLIAKQRRDPPTARRAFEEALEHWPEDAEVVRSLGELDLRAGDFPGADKNFEKALGLASRDKRLEAEIWSLRAEALQGAGDAKALPMALLKCAAAFAEIDDYSPAGAAYSKAGDAQVSIRHTKRARQSYRSAFDCYERAGSTEQMKAMRAKLVALKVDDSSLPIIDQPTSWQIPWFWVRFSLEVLILGAALYVTFMPK